jgi:uncharacterized protein
MDNQARPPSERTRITRMPARAAYDRAIINAILDEGVICHIGFVADGQPVVLPTIYARDGDRLLLHGSAASRMLRSLRDGVPVCVTVTLQDGLVLARSAYHHSMNYRSVVIFGIASEIVGAERKIAAMESIVNHVMPGRWSEVRHPNDGELKATMVLSLPISEASAKVRTGPPLDDEEDYAINVWAGELPLRLVAQAPKADPRLPADAGLPCYLTDYIRARSCGHDESQIAGNGSRR